MQTQPLIFIPGLGCNQELFHYQIEHLQDLFSCQVITFDTQATRQEMADFILDEAPPSFFLVGQSMGGWVAQEIAAKQPKRTLKLVLLNTWTRPNPIMIATLQHITSALEQGQFEAVLTQFFAKLVHPQRLKEAEFVDSIQSMQRKTSPNTLCKRIKAMMQDYSTLSLLPRITSPTLVIHGRQDALFPSEEGEILVKNMPQARLALIEDCGHTAPLEQPQAVTALIRLWLT